MDRSTPDFPVLHYLAEFTHSVMLSKHLIFCLPLLLLPSVSARIRILSNEQALHSRCPKYWRFSMSPSNEYSVLISFRIDGFISLQSNRLSRVFSRIKIQKHQLSSVHGISQARILEWVAISFSRGPSRLRRQTYVSCIGRWIPYRWAPRETPTNTLTHTNFELVSHHSEDVA